MAIFKEMHDKNIEEQTEPGTDQALRALHPFLVTFSSRTFRLGLLRHTNDPREAVHVDQRKNRRARVVFY
eukprot:scaffold3240_cov187-Amphora_coffeaeformis.AAC.12